MKYTVQGIVLKQVDYKDSDVIVTILNKNSETFTFYARGIRKAKSKNSYACSLFTEGEYSLQSKDEKRYQLLTAVCKHSYSQLFSDYEKLIYASVICDLVYEISTKENLELYSLLQDCLQTMASDSQHNLILALFLVEILQKTGVSLLVDGCGRCGSTTVNSISLADGGFVCENCRDENAVVYEEDILRKFRYLNKAKLENIEQLAALGEYPIELISLLYQFLQRYTGLYSKAMRFLDSLTAS